MSPTTSKIPSREDVRGPAGIKNLGSFANSCIPREDSFLWHGRMVVAGYWKVPAWRSERRRICSGSNGRKELRRFWAPHGFTKCGLLSFFSRARPVLLLSLSWPAKLVLGLAPILLIFPRKQWQCCFEIRFDQSDEFNFTFGCPTTWINTSYTKKVAALTGKALNSVVPRPTKNTLIPPSRHVLDRWKLSEYLVSSFKNLPNRTI